MDLLNQIKGIKLSLEDSTIYEISMHLRDFKENLIDYEVDLNLDEDDIAAKEYQINKLYNIVVGINLFNLKYRDISMYIDKLITIVEFIES